MWIKNGIRSSKQELVLYLNLNPKLSGTGKSSIVLNLLLNLPKEKFLPNIINFSARTSSNITQDMIMTKLDRRRKGVYGPAMGKKYVIFIGERTTIPLLLLVLLGDKIILYEIFSGSVVEK